MKVFSLSFFILVSLLGAAQKKCPIIPHPIAANLSKDQFKLDRYSLVKISDPKLTGIANYFKAEIRKMHPLVWPPNHQKMAQWYRLCSPGTRPKTAQSQKVIQLT